jgi:hypothetical protein
MGYAPGSVFRVSLGWGEVEGVGGVWAGGWLEGPYVADRPVNGVLNASNDFRTVATKLVLPNPHHAPSRPSQCAEVPPVTSNCLIYLLLPEMRDRVPPGREPVSVPEVSVHEHDDALCRKDYVRLAWKRLDVLSEPQTLSMKGSSKLPLWRRILAPDARHAVRALGGSQIVRHYCLSANSSASSDIRASGVLTARIPRSCLHPCSARPNNVSQSMAYIPSRDSCSSLAPAVESRAS